jgi:hypothetical protein
VANWSERSGWILVYAPYALVQVLAMPSLGAWYWACRAIEQRHWGRNRSGYRRGPQLRDRSGHVVVDFRGATAVPNARGALALPWAEAGLGPVALVRASKGLTVTDAFARLAAERRVRPWLVPELSPSR